MEAKLIRNSKELEALITSLKRTGYKQAGISYALEDWLSVAEHTMNELDGKFMHFKQDNQELLFCVIGFNHALYKRNRDEIAKKLLYFLNEDAVNKLKTIGSDTYLILSIYWSKTDSNANPAIVEECLQKIFHLYRSAHFAICQTGEKVQPTGNYKFDSEKNYYYSVIDGVKKIQYYFHEVGDVHIYHRLPELDLRNDDNNYELLNPVVKIENDNEIREQVVFLAVPESAALNNVFPDYNNVESMRFELNNYSAEGQTKVFVRREFEKCNAKIVRLNYNQLLAYQKSLNISLLKENIETYTLQNGLEVPLFVYSIEGDYSQDTILNERLTEMIKTREREWALVPDIVLMYPVEVANVENIARNVSSYNSDMILYTHYLNMRLQCETGVPYGHDGADMMERFKNRIERYYLGEVKCRITEEMIMDIMDKEDVSVGSDIVVQLMVSVDKESNVGVLYVVSLSSPFLLSHLIDNVVRNQLIVIDEGKTLNLYEFILKKWGLTIAGTPKSYITIPAEKDALKPEQLASLLMSETIYGEGEEFGQVVDKEILNVASGKYGMALYNIAYVGVTTNTYIQFWPTYQGSKQYRLFWNAVTAFYIELVLFEEAAVNIFNKNLVSLMTEANRSEPEDFLEQNRNITVKFLNTVEFWNVQLNYQSSQKSIKLIRDSFGQEKLITRMERYHEQVRNIFEINKELVDRKAEREEKESSDEMNFILFILTIVSTFSALYQIIDYIMTYALEAPIKNLFPAVANIIAAIGLFSFHMIRKRSQNKKTQKKS